MPSLQSIHDITEIIRTSMMHCGALFFSTNFWCFYIHLYRIKLYRTLGQKGKVVSGLVIDKEICNKSDDHSQWKEYWIKCIFNCNQIQQNQLYSLIDGYINENNSNIKIPKSIIHLILSFYDDRKDYFGSNSMINDYKIYKNAYLSITKGQEIEILCNILYPTLTNRPKMNISVDARGRDQVYIWFIFASIFGFILIIICLYRDRVLMSYDLLIDVMLFAVTEIVVSFILSISIRVFVIKMKLRSKMKMKWFYDTKFQDEIIKIYSKNEKKNI